MNPPATPKDGDFASYVQGAASKPVPSPIASSETSPLQAEDDPQTLQQVLEGEEPSEAFLEEMRALQDAPELADEELARQALEAPGGDGDPSTPE
jgi:hypothetical protein